MKYIYFLLLFPMGMFYSCSSEITIAEDKIPDEIFYIEGHSMPYTGRCLVKYNNSNQIHFIFNYKDGVLNGPFRSFYKNGKIRDDGNYVDGELEGKFIRHEEGGATNSYTFKMGELSGNT